MEFTFTTTKYIVIGVLITIVIIIAILLSFGKMKKLKEKLLTQGKSLTDGITNNGFQIWQMVLYIIILIAIANLFPTAWKWYWGDKTFFFMSQMCLITFILLGIIQSARKKKDRDYEMKGKGWFQFTLIVIILTAFLLRLPWDELGKSKDTETETYAQMQESAREITVPVRAWVRVDIPNPDETAWQMTRNPSYGLENTKTLIRVAINGDRENSKPSGQLDDGTMKSPYFHETLVKFVEFRSDTVPAHILMNFVKM